MPRINTAEAALYTGIAKSTLDTARARQDTRYPPYIKIGRRILYDTEDLDLWLKAHKVGVTGKTETEAPPEQTSQ